jgi:predicted anti-sigma-YlaC factor YlaD
MELVARLGEYMEGVLSPEEQKLFEAHMRTCSGCHRFYVQLGLLQRALGSPAMSEGEYPSRTSELFAEWKRTRSAPS